MAEQVLITSLMRALSLFRWATLVVAWVGLALSQEHLVQPVLAVALLAAATALTAVFHLWGRSQPELLTRTSVLAVEVGLAAALLVGDGIVYTAERAQSLPWAFPAAGIAAVGIARGGHLALAVAAFVGAISLNTEVIILDRFSVPGDLPAAVSKIGLWMLVGGLAGPLTDRLRRAEQQISVARAREELARQLHDGVLQTLAVVQRRSGDPELAALARDQENTLRSFLSDDRLMSGSPTPMQATGTGALSLSATEPGLEPALRAAAAQAERRYGFVVKVLVAPDCPPLPDDKVQASAGAVSEALTNAAKHGDAERVTVFAEPSDDNPPPGGTPATVVVSVKDNGRGFDPDEVTHGIGLRRSIQGRIEDVGGTVEVSGGLGRGTEIMLWL